MCIRKGFFKRFCMLVCTFLFLLLAGAFVYIFVTRTRSDDSQVYEATSFVMGTVVSQTVYGGQSDCITDMNTLLEQLEQQYLSWREEDSMLACLNASHSLQLSGDFKEWIQNAFSLAKDTDGAFDPTLRPLIALWGIEGDTPAVPTQEKIEACLLSVGYEQVKITEDTITLPEYMSLDLGAVGKGIALDVLRTYLSSSDVTAATVAVGGSVLTYGSKDSGAWNIALQDPAEYTGTSMGVLKLTGTHSISTSGDYEKYFEEDGVIYHHIFDRRTGYPADTNLHSVTVVCDNGLYSDGLSTACFVLGYEDSLPVLEAYDAEAVFIFKDNTVAVTDGLLDYFSLINENYKMRK